MPASMMIWTDSGGNVRAFTVYPFTAPIERMARLVQVGLIPITGRAIYIFARLNPVTETWTPLYVGESGDVNERILDHDEIENLRKLDVTHVHLHSTFLNKSGRVRLEHSLRRAINPVLNPLPLIP